jgi:hypothetical protein
MKPLILVALAGMSLGALAGCDQTPERPAEPTPLAQFDKADANKDGVIERHEATSIANQAFSDVDTDENQAVSLDEFEVALRTATQPSG